MYGSPQYDILMIMIRILILLVGLSFATVPSLADDPTSGSVSVEFLEYRLTNDTTLVDAEAEYGTHTHRAVLKLVTLSANGETDAATALLYRRAMAETLDFQVGVEVSGDVSNFVLGFQAQAPHDIKTELVTLFAESGKGYLIGKIEHDFMLAEHLVLWPRLEVFAAFQDDEATATGRGLSAALADLRLRYEMHPRFMPYVGVSWERALGNSARMLESAGEDTSIVTAVAGASFAF